MDIFSLIDEDNDKTLFQAKNELESLWKTIDDVITKEDGRKDIK